MDGKERILTALEVRKPDRVPLYVHGINEAPITGIGKHLTGGLREPRDFRLMTDMEKLKLVGDSSFALQIFYTKGSIPRTALRCSRLF